MAITSTQQTDILKVVAGLFNAAPGGTNLSDLANAVDGGMTIKQLANVLASNTLFTNGIMAGKVTTDAQAAVLMNNFGLVADDTTTSAGSQALAYFKAQIDAGAGFGDIVYDAVTFLSTTTDATFTTAATLLANKALVAASYSASNSSSDLSVLQNVVDTVTGTAPFTAADVATVLAALSDDVAPAVTAPAGNFSFTENQAAAATLATIAATDNVAVTGFEIASGNDSGFFAIDAAGKITLTTAGLTSAANDFETTPNSFTLGVKAIDSAGNKSAAVDVILDVTNVDEAGPALSSQVLSGNKAILTFDEAFDAASIPAGTSFLVTESGTTNIAINAVSVSGQIVTLTLATTPTGTTTVSYTPPGTSPLQDAIGNDVAAFSNKTLTVDTTAPTLSSSTPADDATAIAIANNLVLTFSETVQAGTGNIVITNASDATDTRTIAVTDAQVAFSGSTVTINPTADLKVGANYNVQIAATAVKDAAGNAYAGITNSTALNFSTVAAPAGQTLTLTVNTDTLTGTSNADTFDASGFFNSGTGTFIRTLQNADSLAGGDGIDTLNVILNDNSAAGVVTRPAAMTSMEVINLTHSNANANPVANTLDLATATGVTTLNSINSANNAPIFANVQSAPTAFGLTNSAFGFTANIVNTALAGTTDSATLTVNGVTAAVVTLQTVTAASGYETLNVVSTGSIANVLTQITQGASTSLATINVSGATAVNLGATTLEASVLTVNASAATGDVTATQTNVNAFAFTGGSGNDTAILGAAYGTTDTINGGAGTADVLSTTTAIAQAIAAAQTNVTNVEQLTISNAQAGAINTTFFSGVTRINLAAAAGSDTNITIDSGDDVRFQTTTTATPNLVVTGIGTTDTATVTLSSAVNLAADALTTTGIETLTLTSLGSTGTTNALNALTMTNTAASEKVVITGAADITSTNAVTADVIDASALTGVLTLTVASVAAGGAGITITGGTGADTLSGSVGADIISGGAGNDIILSEAGIDIVSLGTGDDTINWTDKTVGADMIASAERDNVTGFTATGTAFSANNGVDRINLGNVHTTTDISGGATAASYLATTTAGNQTLTNAQQFLELVWEFSSAVDLNAGTVGALNGTTLLSALGATTGTTAGTITVGTNDFDAIVVAYQGGRAFVYGSANADGNTGIVAAEIGLLGVFEGVAVGGFDFSQFI